MSGTVNSLSPGTQIYQREGFIALVNTTNAFYEAVLTSLRVNSLRAPNSYPSIYIWSPPILRLRSHHDQPSYFGYPKITNSYLEHPSCIFHTLLISLYLSVLGNVLIPSTQCLEPQALACICWLAHNPFTDPPPHFRPKCSRHHVPWSEKAGPYLDQKFCGLVRSAKYVTGTEDAAVVRTCYRNRCESELELPSLRFPV
jgi:hypothetical protein